MPAPTPGPFGRFFLLPALALAGACTGGGGGSFGIASDPPGLATIRTRYSYPVEVRHAGGPVEYELLVAPPGMTVSADGLVEWTPAYADLGSHAVELSATDGERTAAQDWTLRVNQGLSLGTALSWRGHTESGSDADFLDHVANHAPWGRVISFHTSWRDPGEHDGEIPDLASLGATLAADHPFTPAIGFGWADGDGDPDLTSDSEPANDSWSNQETRDEFRGMVTAFAALHQPPYLFLGNETNTYYLRHSAAEWTAWLSEFAACYDAVKAVSPATMVFTTFQLEHMKGLGLATNGWTDPPDWTPLDDHVASGRIDAVGFTTYPYFEHSTPGAIPAAYYDEIASHWSGPVVFTELGWLAAPHFPYPGGEIDQADFVAVFFDRTRDLGLEYADWLFLHDWDGQAATPAFADVGLRDNLATLIRLADAAWRAEVALRE
ncbi:MAG: hypothetical protein AB1726_11900 [Planctomycetota bacterium]